MKEAFDTIYWILTIAVIGKLRVLLVLPLIPTRSSAME